MTVDVIRAFESFVDDLSNWYIRCSRRRFWEGDETALRVLWHAVVQSLTRDRPRICRSSPSTSGRCSSASRARTPPTRCSSPAGPSWPSRTRPRSRRWRTRAQVVDLGRAARSTSGFKLRQPLARLVVEGVAPADELVAVVARRAAGQGRRARPRRGRARGQAEPPGTGAEAGPGARRRARRTGAGVFEDLGDGRFRAAGHELSRDEVLVERSGARRLGDRLLRRRHGRARHRARRVARCARAASTS